MTPLGFKRSELADGSFNYPCSPCCSDDPKAKADYDNEEIHPEVEFVGKQADVMGAGDLKLDDEIEVTLRLKVKGLKDESRKIGDKTQRDLRLNFKILEASDYTLAKGEAAEEATEDSPVGALLGAKKS